MSDKYPGWYEKLTDAHREELNRRLTEFFRNHPTDHKVPVGFNYHKAHG